MRKWLWCLLLVCLLAGCGSAETFETLGQVQHQSDGEAALRQVVLTLPEDAALSASDTDQGFTMYDCADYTILMQTFSSGDMTSTIRALTGFSSEKLTVLESACGDHARYDWVWTAVAEEGDLVCRGTVLDDGDYHYCLCVMAEADEAGELTSQWNALFGSFCLDS